MKSNLEIIKEKVIEVVPEILEVKNGCLVKGGGIIWNDGLYFNYDEMTDNLDIDETEIIGRLIQLSDVLRALDLNSTDEKTRLSASANYFRIDYKEDSCIWDLSKPLEEQSEEVLDFLVKLLDNRIKQMIELNESKDIKQCGWDGKSEKCFNGMNMKDHWQKCPMQDIKQLKEEIINHVQDLLPSPHYKLTRKGEDVLREKINALLSLAVEQEKGKLLERLENLRWYEVVNGGYRQKGKDFVIIPEHAIPENDMLNKVIKLLSLKNKEN